MCGQSGSDDDVMLVAIHRRPAIGHYRCQSCRMARGRGNLGRIAICDWRGNAELHPDLGRRADDTAERGDVYSHFDPVNEMRIVALLACLAASGSANAAQVTITATFDATASLLPAGSDGTANWRLAGTAIPVRTTISATLSPSGGDDTGAINAALAACPSGQVVQLTAGVFRISGGGLNLTTSCTLRGVGPGSQKNTGLNAVGAQGASVASCEVQTNGNQTVYCPDLTATQLIKADRASNRNYQLLSVGPARLDTTGYGGPTGTSYNLAADAVQGSKSILLATAPNIHVGDIVLLDENTDNDPQVVYGPSFGPPGDGSRRWFTRQDRSLSQLVEVASVIGTTITFTTPITYPFHTANAAQMTVYTGGTFLHSAGIEDLFVWGGMGGDGHGNIAIVNCAYCWVKNVEAAWSIGSSVGFYSTFRSVLRDSFIHETPDANPGGAGYLMTITNGASENLIENNIFWYGNKVVTMRGSGGGNVFAYNHTDDSFGSSFPHSPEAGVNAGHFTTPHLELLEGNYSPNFKGDSYWGNSIYITVYRNWLSGSRAARPPLNAYRYQLSCGPLPYGDYSGRTAVDIQAYSFHHNFIGNVLGSEGQTLNNYGSQACFDSQERAFMPQVTTAAQWSTAGNNNAYIMWQIGTYQATVNTTGQWSFVDSTINTQTRNGNWDWVTKAQHWYGTGGIVDGVAPMVLPPSLYLSAKPAFFGSQQWPWVDPATGHTAVLPAKYCFEHGLMPTCLQ